MTPNTPRHFTVRKIFSLLSFGSPQAPCQSTIDAHHHLPTSPASIPLSHWRNHLRRITTESHATATWLGKHRICHCTECITGQFYVDLNHHSYASARRSPISTLARTSLSLVHPPTPRKPRLVLFTLHMFAHHGNLRQHPKTSNFRLFRAKVKSFLDSVIHRSMSVRYPLVHHCQRDHTHGRPTDKKPSREHGRQKYTLILSK